MAQIAITSLPSKRTLMISQSTKWDRIWNVQMLSLLSSFKSWKPTQEASLQKLFTQRSSSFQLMSSKRTCSSFLEEFYCLLTWSTSHLTWRPKQMQLLDGYSMLFQLCFVCYPSIMKSLFICSIRRLSWFLSRCWCRWMTLRNWRFHLCLCFCNF